MPTFLGRQLRDYILVLGVLALVSAAAQAVPGTFRGRVHEGADIKPGWIYVEAINGNLRLVDVRRANIHYEDVEEDAPPSDRARGQDVPQLVTGTEVRVTAEQDRKGHWHASEVEVLRETSRK